MGREAPKLELVRPDVVETGAVLLPDESISDVRPDLSIQTERFATIARELPPLFERHWQALGSHRKTIPLQPDWDRYFGLDAQGILHVMTARSGDTLAGYIFNLVGPHLHYANTIHAEIEMFWLDEAYQGGWFPVRWFKANDEMLRSLKVRRISVAVKNGYKNGKVGLIFKRLGYLPIETSWAKVL